MRSGLLASLEPPVAPPLPPLSPFRQFAPPTPQGGWVTGPTGGSTYHHNGITYVGMLGLDATVRIISYNHATKALTISPAILTFPTSDFHGTPSVIVRASDGKVVVAVCGHAVPQIYVAISTHPEDVSAWGAPVNIGPSVSASLATYCYLVQLSAEANKMWLFWREGTSSSDRLYYSTSVNGGGTWSPRGRIYNNTLASQGFYWSIDSDDISRIDFIVGDGTAGQGTTPASLYHFYYEGGAWFRSNGAQIRSATPPVPGLTPPDLTKVFDGGVLGALAQPQQVITAGATPIGGWAAWDPAGGDARYWTGFCDANGSWTVSELATTGTVPSGGTGGFAIDPVDPTRAYVSRKVDGVFQIFLYERLGGGTVWTQTRTITDDQTGEVNVGPLAPRHAARDLRCVWLFGCEGKDIPSTSTTIDQVGNQIRVAREEDVAIAA